jgi:hypothetical protein
MPDRMLNALILILHGFEIVDTLIFDFDGVIAAGRRSQNAAG